MTVHSGRGWRLAPSLIAFEQEANRLAPRRSQASDGSIGDAAHRARVSDHNPDGGWVHGLDLTHDPRGGFDAHAHGRSIAARRDPRVAYLISNGQIWTPDRGWQRYTGPNPHRTHLHTSLHHTPAARNDTGLWLPWVTGSPVMLPPKTTTPTTAIATPISEEYDMVLRNIQDGAIWAVSATHMHHLSPDEWAKRTELEKVTPFPVQPLYILALAAGGRTVI